MTIDELTQGLKEIENGLKNFVSIDNKNGFFKHFVPWVVKHWDAAEYYSCRTVKGGYNVSYYPERTKYMLKDKIKTYGEFFNANTGSTQPTYCSGSNIDCETFESRLEEYFGDVCYELIEKEAERLNLIVPDEFKKETKNVAEFIYLGMVDYDKHKEFNQICDDIILYYGRYGCALAPYCCKYYGFADETDWSAHPLAELTLEDFKKIAQSQ